MVVKIRRLLLKPRRRLLLRKHNDQARTRTSLLIRCEISICVLKSGSQQRRKRMNGNIARLLGDTNIGLLRRNMSTI